MCIHFSKLELKLKIKLSRKGEVGQRFQRDTTKSRTNQDLIIATSSKLTSVHSTIPTFFSVASISFSTSAFPPLICLKLDDCVELFACASAAAAAEEAEEEEEEVVFGLVGGGALL
jgi:hypothetical protein